MPRTRTTVLALCSALIGSATALASRSPMLVAADGACACLYAVEDDGTVTVLAEIEGTVPGPLAVDARDTVFLVDLAGSRLMRVDPSTGTVATVGPLAAGIDALAIAPTAVAGKFRQPAFRPGTMFASTGGAAGPWSLLVVDPATAVVTPLAPLDRRLTALAFRQDGKLFGLSPASAAEVRLVSVEAASGAMTDIAALEAAPGAAPGMVFDPSDRLLVTDPAAAAIFEVDLATGQWTLAQALPGHQPAGLGELLGPPHFEGFSTTPASGPLTHQTLYNLSLDGTQVEQTVPSFLTDGLGLDAVDLEPSGDVLFSVRTAGGLVHAGGYVQLKEDRVYRYVRSTGAVESVTDWGTQGLVLGSLDALDVGPEGRLAFSVSTTRGVTHAGGYVVLRPQSVYSFDPASGTIETLLDGLALGLSDIDAVDVSGDGTVAFSLASTTYVGGQRLDHRDAYVREPDGGFSTRFDGQTLGLPGLDALTLSESGTPVARFVPDVATPGPTAVALELVSADDQGQFVLDVRVGGGADIFGGGFELRYDPTIVEFEEWSPGTLLETDGMWVGRLVSTPVPGRLVVGATRTGDVPGSVADGPTALLRLAFRVIRFGSTRMDFHAPFLSDSAAVEIADLSWFGGQVVAE